MNPISQSIPPSALDASGSVWAPAQDPAVPAPQMPRVLQRITDNQTSAADLIRHLESGDPAATVEATVRQAMLDTCRKIRDNTSIRDVPRLGFRTKVDLPLPLRHSDLVAIDRDKCSLNEMTDLLRLHAIGLMQPVVEQVRQRCAALRPLCAGRRTAALEMAQHFVQDTIPRLRTARPAALGISGDQRYASHLLERLRAVQAAYGRINRARVKVDRALPMPQLTCARLVTPLEEAERYADQLNLQDCERLLLQFDVRFMALQLQREQPEQVTMPALSPGTSAPQRSSSATAADTQNHRTRPAIKPRPSLQRVDRQ